MGEIVKLVSGTSSIPNLGLPEKFKVLLVHKQQPNLQMEANSINLCSVFDIASALQQGWFLITVTSRPWKKPLEMPQACLKAGLYDEIFLSRPWNFYFERKVSKYFRKRNVCCEILFSLFTQSSFIHTIIITFHS